MNLRKELENKIQLLDIRLLKAKHGVSYTQELVTNLINKTKEDLIQQVFIRKRIEIDRTNQLLLEYTKELLIYKRHREIILGNPKRVSKAVELLGNLEDKISNLIATLQAIAIVLEGSEYN